MWDAEIYVAGLAIALLQICLHHRFQGGDAKRNALGQQRRRFGHCQTMIVLKEDVQCIGHVDYPLFVSMSGLLQLICTEHR